MNYAGIYEITSEAYLMSNEFDIRVVLSSRILIMYLLEWKKNPISVGRLYKVIDSNINIKLVNKYGTCQWCQF